MAEPSSGGGDHPAALGRWSPLVLIPLALTAWAYYPITRINFFADDLVNFASIESDRTVEYLLAPFGGHNLLVRNLFFLASWELFGLRAPLYYATVLLTHLVNVGLLFGTLRFLSGSAALACFGAALWGTSPLCVGTLGWYSVYGQVLVATILLFVLNRLTRLAGARAPVTPSATCLWYGLLLAGTTCFGVGIGVVLGFPLVVFLLVPSAWSRPRVRVAWLLLPIVGVSLYFAFRRLYPLIGALSFQESMQEYMVLSGFGALPATLAHLLAFSIAGSTLSFLLPRTYPSPASWAAVVAYSGGLGLLAWRGDTATRRAAVAMVALAVSVYLLIALGRANAYAMFSIAPAGAAQVARYHYVGSLPVVMLFCLILRELGRLPGLRRVPAAVPLTTGLAGIAYGMATVGITFHDYRGTPDYLTKTAAAIAAEVRAWPPGSTAYVDNDRTPFSILGPALPNFLFPGRAAVFLLLHASDDLEGRTVRFIERDGEVLSYYAGRPRSRLARLLVAADAAPARP